MESTKDEQIVKACQSGDMESFSRLYDKYVKKIYNFIYYKTCHRETAEDLTSQTFIKSLEAINNFNPDRGSFSSWLYRIARNNVIDYYRKSSRKKTVNVCDFWGIKDKSNLHYDVELKERVEEVEKYLQSLKSEYREIVVMRLWDGLSYAEIAEITEREEANCRMIFSRTISKMKKELILLMMILSLIN
jgi:RNA polymerase sigma-70 factor (ECF subfamily)